MSTKEGTWRPLLRYRAERRAALAWIALASLGFAAALVLFLLARRLLGALSEPLPPTTLLVTAIAATSWVVASRLAIGSIASSETPIVSRLVDWCLPVLLVTLAVACSYPGRRLVDWLVWLSAIAVAWWVAQMQTAPARRGVAAKVRVAAQPSFSENEQVLQQLTRARTAEGLEVVSGTLLAEFAPGERTVTLHAAFCPPFERLPQVEVEATDATVKLVQVLHNGVRLDVRRAMPALEPCRVSVELRATEVSS
jgi:hypothetical protein